MRAIGFSTGSIALGDFQGALDRVRSWCTSAIELSALRFGELEPLVRASADLDVRSFSHVSVHAPGSYEPRHEEWIVERLLTVAKLGWPIVLHPDAICDYRPWLELEDLLLIENMDKRKTAGRTSQELEQLFVQLPAAGLCFDIAHARQVDPSMVEAYAILQVHRDRVRQIHISEVNTSSAHTRISRAAAADYEEVAPSIPADVPIILETPVTRENYRAELAMACRALQISAEDTSVPTA
jgi:hypothetical protein